MTYLDLLKYLIDVQKIEKEDLAELIGIPQKKMDSVLAGAVPLKKKWLKNLSLYTGIPTESIVAGNFVLNYPQGDALPVVKDAYVPEAIREANTQRLNAYVKKRYKTFRDDVVYMHPICTILAVLCLIVLIGFVFLFSVTALSDLVKVMFMGLIPVIISISVIRNSFRFAKKGVPADEKNFKFYAVLVVLQIFISTISAVAFKWALPVALAGALGTVLPLIYLVFVQGNNSKVGYIKSFLLSIASLVFFLGVYFCFLEGEKVEAVENATQFTSLAVIYGSSWLSTLVSIGSVFVSYNLFRKRNGISKHFGAVVKKPVLKKGRAVKSAIAIVLACAVIFATIYIAPVVLLDGEMSTAIDEFNEEKVETRYIDYNKEDISFGEDEQVVTIEKENYSIKLPVYLEKNEKITTRDGYQNKEKMTVVFIEENYLDYSDVFTYDGDDEEKKASFERLNKAIKDRYGFIPKGQYEYFKLLKLISEDNISPFNRELSLAVSLFTNLEKMMAHDNVYLYEDSEKCFCICENIIERDSGNFTHTYSIEGNAKGDYDKFFSITVMVVTETPADMDLPFKIINSIEMK